MHLCIWCLNVNNHLHLQSRKPPWELSLEIYEYWDICKSMHSTNVHAHVTWYRHYIPYTHDVPTYNLENHPGNFAWTLRKFRCRVNHSPLPATTSATPWYRPGTSAGCKTARCRHRLSWRSTPVAASTNRFYANFLQLEFHLLAIARLCN